MFGWLKKKAAAATGVAVLPAVHAPVQRRLTELSAIAYPPQDPGLPVSPVKTLLNDQAEVLGMLRMHAAQPVAVFDARFFDPIERVASYINLLPGTPQRGFSGAGGLFRAAVESAFSIFRASDGRIFTGDKGVEERHALEGRWRYVAFLAGLMYPLSRPLEVMAVVDEKGGKWAPELEGLTEWCEARGTTRLYASWARQDVDPGPSSLAATFALKLVGRENVEWLNAGSPVLVQTLMDIVTGAPRANETRAGALVREMWALIKEREEARVPQMYGQLTIGTDVAPYLLDAVAGLYKSRWKLNESVAFADANALYLQWPAAGIDIIEFCRDKSYAGIPSSPGALLAMLVQANIIAAGSQDDLEEIATQDGEIVSAVCLARPGLILEPNQSLADIAAKRPIRVADIRANDVIETAAQAAEAGKTPATSKPTPAPAKAPPKLEVMNADELAAAAGADDDAGDEETAAPVLPAGAEFVADAALAQEATPIIQQPAAPRDASRAAAVAPASRTAPAASQRARQADHASQRGPTASAATKPATSVEGREIRYRDLLPTEVAQSMPRLTAEYLGQVVHIYRTKDNGNLLMRRCEHGLAFDLELLKAVCSDPPAFLATLAENGMLYTAPGTPRRLFYNVAVTEGSREVRSCFILPAHTTNRLGLE